MADQAQDRYRNRRAMAWLSFLFLLVLNVALLLFGLHSDENAKRVVSLSFIIGTIDGVWTTIILSYYGVTAYTDVKEIMTAAGTPK
jgi:hypothetical protein